MSNSTKTHILTQLDKLKKQNKETGDKEIGDLTKDVQKSMETNTDVKDIDLTMGDGFEFEGGDSEDDEDESDDEEQKLNFPSIRLAQRKAVMDDDDVNIDDI